MLNFSTGSDCLFTRHLSVSCQNMSNFYWCPFFRHHMSSLTFKTREKIQEPTLSKFHFYRKQLCEQNLVAACLIAESSFLKELIALNLLSCLRMIWWNLSRHLAALHNYSRNHYHYFIALLKKNCAIYWESGDLGLQNKSYGPCWIFPLSTLFQKISNHIMK